MKKLKALVKKLDNNEIVSYELTIDGQSEAGHATKGSLENILDTLAKAKAKPKKVNKAAKAKKQLNVKEITSGREDRKKKIFAIINRYKKGVSRQGIAEKLGLPENDRSLINSLGAFVRNNEIVKIDEKYRKAS